jgi:hypothetical protein
MFKKSSDERLTEWSELRKSLDHIDDPFKKVLDFWNNAPSISYNHRVDPYNVKSWPTPWEIIVENKYDDFTLALMIGYTLKLSNRFKSDRIEIRTMVDYPKTKLYNLVYINENVILNYDKNCVVNSGDIDQNLYLENLIEVIFPR